MQPVEGAARAGQTEPQFAGFEPGGWSRRKKLALRRVHPLVE